MFRARRRARARWTCSVPSRYLRPVGEIQQGSVAVGGSQSAGLWLVRQRAPAGAGPGVAEVGEGARLGWREV
jgi:hypothetical protein